jgi:Xaa-Pro dipeptidase
MNRQRATSLLNDTELEGVLAVAPENILWATGYEVFQSVWNRFARGAFIPVADARPFVVLAMPEVPFAVDDEIDRFADLWGFGAPANLVPAGDGVQLEPATGRVNEILKERRLPDVVSTVLAALKDGGTASGRIAVDGLAAPQFIHHLNAAGSEWEFVPGGEELLRLMRMVKTPEEVDKLRRAADLNNRAIAAALEVLATDTFAAASETHRAVVNEAGGLVQHWSIASGRASSTIRRPRATLPEKGDRGWYESGLILGGYVSDIGGTFQVGAEPSPEELRTYEAISAGIDAGVASAIPGVTASQIYDKIMAAVRAAGMPDFTYSMAGHGIGVEPRDYPMITPPASAVVPYLPEPFDALLEPGMVLNFEVPFHEMGIGTFQHEVTCVVTDDSAMYLSPRREYTVL